VVVQDGGQRCHRSEYALLPLEASYERDPWGSCSQCRIDGPGGRALARVDAIGNHRDLVEWDVMGPGDLVGHRRRAHDHRVRLIDQPLLDQMDAARHRVRKPTGVATGLSGVHGCDQRHAVSIAGHPSCSSDHPVVGVNHVHLAHGRTSVADPGIQSADPGEQRRQVVREGCLGIHSDDLDPGHGLVFLRTVDPLCDHRDPVPASGLRCSQGRHVATDPAIDQWWVLPTEMQDVH
jgi:hypothetical protein